MARAKPAVVVNLDVLSGANDHFRYRSFVLKSPAYAISIGRCSKSGGADGKLIAQEDNGWFDSRVVSRTHAIIKAFPDMKAVFVEDAGSMHGTYVNERKISSREKEMLAYGDEIRFGTDVTRGPNIFPPVRVQVTYDWIKEYGNPVSNEIESVFEVSDGDSSDVELIEESVPRPNTTGSAPSHPVTFSVPDSDDSDAGSFISGSDREDDDGDAQFRPSSARTMMKDLQAAVKAISTPATSPQTSTDEVTSQPKTPPSQDREAIIEVVIPETTVEHLSVTQVTPKTSDPGEEAAQKNVEHDIDEAMAQPSGFTGQPESLIYNMAASDLDLENFEGTASFGEEADADQSDSGSMDDNHSVALPLYEAQNMGDYDDGDFEDLSESEAGLRNMSPVTTLPTLYGSSIKTSSGATPGYGYRPTRQPSPSDAAMPKPATAATTETFPGYASWSRDWSRDYVSDMRLSDYSQWPVSRTSLERPEESHVSETYPPPPMIHYSPKPTADGLTLTDQPSTSMLQKQDECSGPSAGTSLPTKSSTRLAIDDIVLQRSSEEPPTVTKPLKRKADEMSVDASDVQLSGDDAIISGHNDKIAIAETEKTTAVTASQEPPTKKARVEVQPNSTIRTIATYTAVATVGALAGAASLFTALISMPPDYFMNENP